MAQSTRRNHENWDEEKLETNSSARVFIPYYTGEVVSAVFGEGAGYDKLHKTVAIMAVLSFSGWAFVWDDRK